MDSPSSPPPFDEPNIKHRLAVLDGLIKQLRRDLDETLELIERLREHCVHIKRKLGEAEREHATLRKEVERL